MDAGAADAAPVTHAQVLAEFAKNIGRLRELLHDVVAQLPGRSAPARAARVHDGVTLPLVLP